MTVTELEGLTIRSAVARPESWPKRRRSPSPAATELGEDSDDDGVEAEAEAQAELDYPKVTLKFKGKSEGASTRSRDRKVRNKGADRVQRRAGRSVDQAVMDLNAREAALESDAATSPVPHATRAVRPGTGSQPVKRVGSQICGLDDQQYWAMHGRFVISEGGVWLRDVALKPGFRHSTKAMMDVCREALHTLKAKPADCMFLMTETDCDHLKYLRTSVVGYKRRLEMGTYSLCDSGVVVPAEEEEEEEEGEEEEEEEEGNHCRLFA